MVVKSKKRWNSSAHIDVQSIQKLRKALLKWYTKHGRQFPWRRRSLSNYKLVTCEILLQRTQANTIAKFFPTFFEKFRSWNDLAIAHKNSIAAALRPIGLHRQRAAALKNLAKAMVARRGRVPKTVEELEQLPGVGQYVSNAAMLLCWSKPFPLLDTNMARVLERIFGSRRLADIRYDPYLQSLATRIVNSSRCRELNWAILDIAATICLPRTPRCFSCPLIMQCKYAEKQFSKMENYEGENRDPAE